MAAYQLYLLLMMISVYLVCSKETSPTKKLSTNLGETAICKNSKLPGGLSRIQLGYDITKLNLFKKPDDGQDDGSRRNVIAFHCSGQDWKHPVIKDTYDLPDEVDHLTGRTDTFNSLTYDYYQNIDEYKTSLKAQSNASAPIENIGTLSRSYTFSYANRMFLEDNKTIHELKGYAYSFDSVLKEPAKLSLDDTFAEHVKNLTGLSYKSSPKPFNKIIEFYGTHYFEYAGYGGKIHLHTEVTSNYSSKNNKEELDLNAGASIKDYVKFENDLDVAHEHMTSDFKENTVITFDIYGGTPPKEFASSNILEKSDDLSSPSAPKIVHKDWVLSVYQYPTILRAAPRPLSDLITDDPNASKQLLIAIAVYRDQAAVQEWKDVMDKINELAIEDCEWDRDHRYHINFLKIKQKDFLYAIKVHPHMYEKDPEQFVTSPNMEATDGIERTQKFLNAWNVCDKWHEIIDPFVEAIEYCRHFHNCIFGCCPSLKQDYHELLDFIKNIPESKACPESPYMATKEFKSILDQLNEFGKTHYQESGSSCCFIPPIG